MAIANEQDLFSAVMTAFPPVRKVLVIAPHPDDEVFGCGGTVSLLCGCGCVVTTIIVTDGALGGDNTDGKLIETRAEESRAAADRLKLGAPIFWGLPDRGVEYGEVLIGRLVETLLETGADLVFLPSPTEWHPDHQAIAFAGAEAIRRLGGERRAAFYEVSAPLPSANLIFDISAAEEEKRQAMRCFPSQLRELPYDTRISGINSYRALHLGAQARSAEAFTLLAATDFEKGGALLLDGPLAHRRNLGFATSGGDLPLVSVIIRSMDRPTLVDTLDSLALQTYSNIEVVLVNAKGAAHRKIEQRCGRFPLRFIDSDEPLRRSRAANRGLDATQGEYLIFLDDDDWFDTNHIQNLATAIGKYPETKAVYAGVRCVDEKKNPLPNKFDAPFDAVQIVAGNFIPIHAVLFSRSLIERGCRLDESLDLYEDWDFWIQLSRHCDFLRIDGLSAVYRIAQHAGFGVNADPVVAASAALALYRKWLNRLDDRQITGLMQTVRNDPLKDGQISGLHQAVVERDGQIASLDQTVADLSHDLAERDRQVAILSATVTDRDVQVAGLVQTVANLNRGVIERDGQIANLSQTVTERDRQIDNLTQAITGRDGQIASLTRAITERDRQVAGLHQTVTVRDGQVTRLSQTLASLEQSALARDVQITTFVHAVAERDGQIASLRQTLDGLNRGVIVRDGQIADLTRAAAEHAERAASLIQTMIERDGRVADLDNALFARDEQIANLAQAVHDKEVHIGNLDHALRAGREQIGSLIQSVAEIRGSTSWRLTSPVRFVGHRLLRIKIVLKALPYALSACGGYRGLVRHVWRTRKDEGIAGIKRRILFSASRGTPLPVIDHITDGTQPDHNDYDEWVRRYDTLTDHDRERIRIRIDNLQRQPFISVVMPVYNPPLNMLEDAIRSVQCQLYPNWELCIADDASTDAGVRKLLQRYADNDSRIKVVFRKENGHISAASNSAFGLVRGEYVALFDNDDLLREHALFWVADAIVANPDAGLIYSDEDKVDQSGRYGPYFKPDWNPDLFRSHNLICHLGVYRADLVRKLGGFREGYEGAQDYDLALRCTEQLAPRQIVHIPRVLYHWRSHPGSTAQAGSEKNYALSAGERALNDHFARTDVSAKAELLDFGMYRVRYAIPSATPLVSLIIPTRNGLNLIRQCIESILAKTTYRNYEILVVDNASDDPGALAYFASLAGDDRIRILRDERPFNYSALNNAAARQARGEYLGLVNNDIEVISPEWLDEMIGLAIQPGIGAVGARLWYPNDSLQHGGVITGIGGVAGHAHKHLPRGHLGYFGRAQLVQTLSAVTGACMVVRKSIFQEVGGLDETNLKVAFNDVDFCLRVREAGYRNVWTPYAELYHHESATRGFEDTPEKQLRFRDEVLYMQKRWGDQLTNDPAYNPNLTLEREDFSYACPPRVVS